MFDLLICDDETTIRNGLKSLIEAGTDKFRVVGTAANGFEAFRLIVELQPDLVLMDINMPGQSGLEVMDQARSAAPDARFIIISGHDEFGYVQKALQLCALDYLLKPVDRHRLLKILDQAAQTLHARRLDRVSLQTAPAGPIGEMALQRLYLDYADPELSLASLARQLHVSESYLTRAFRKHTGTSFSEMLTRIRMETAIQLLAQPELACQVVAERVGFKNQHYFSKVFKAYTGSSPSDYRKSAQAD